MFLFTCCHRLESGKFGTSHLALNNPTENSTLNCASTLLEANWLSIIEDMSHSCEVFHSHSSCCCQQGTSDLAEVGLHLLPSLKTYMRYPVE